jgi:hypothetical protein
MYELLKILCLRYYQGDICAYAIIVCTGTKENIKSIYGQKINIYLFPFP